MASRITSDILKTANSFDKDELRIEYLRNNSTAAVKEMININILLTEEMKVIADDLAKHIHIGIPTSGVSGPPQPAPHAQTYINYSSIIQPDIRERYENIQNNLKDMLSRFAKTS